MTTLAGRTGTLAVALGAVGFGSIASLALFFAVGGPFGAINDWSIGLIGILTAWLALRLSSRGAGAAPGVGALPTGLALIGSAVVVLGSALVISRTTGFFLAGLVESLGFALVGVWLVVLSRSKSETLGWPRRMPAFGTVTGVIMAVGVAVLPGITAGIDDMAAATAWVWIGFVGWLGIFFLFPAWAIWFGTALRSGTGAAPSEAATSR